MDQDSEKIYIPTSGDVAENFWVNARHHSYDFQVMTDLMSTIDLCRGHDDEFMIDFWNYMRTIAQEEEEFCAMLIESEIMSHEDIFAVPIRK